MGLSFCKLRLTKCSSGALLRRGCLLSLSRFRSHSHSYSLRILRSCRVGVHPACCRQGKLFTCRRCSIKFTDSNDSIHLRSITVTPFQIPILLHRLHRVISFQIPILHLHQDPLFSSRPPILLISLQFHCHSPPPTSCTSAQSIAHARLLLLTFITHMKRKHAPSRRCLLLPPRSHSSSEHILRTYTPGVLHTFLSLARPHRIYMSRT